MDERIICRHCWMRCGLHRASDHKCPPRGEQYPKWDFTLDDTKAGKQFDEQLAAYWEKSTTWFKEKI